MKKKLKKTKDKIWKINGKTPKKTKIFVKESPLFLVAAAILYTSTRSTFTFAKGQERQTELGSVVFVRFNVAWTATS